MSYTLQLDFGTGWEDHTASLHGQFPFRRNRSIHNKLKPVIGTCSFSLIRNPDLVKRFLSATVSIEVKVQQDSVDWFRGSVRPTDKLRVGRTSVEAFKVEAVEDRKSVV